MIKNTKIGINRKTRIDQTGTRIDQTGTRIVVTKIKISTGIRIDIVTKTGVIKIKTNQVMVRRSRPLQKKIHHRQKIRSTSLRIGIRTGMRRIATEVKKTVIVIKISNPVLNPNTGNCNIL